MADRRHVVITGAGGYLGGLLADHLAALGGYELTLVGRSAQAGRDMLVADITEWDERWVSACRGAHAIVHLAGQRTDNATWAQVQRSNIDGTLNLFQAAALGGARRVVFASTSWVLGGYFKSHRALTPDMEPRPNGLYAASKAAGESIARHFAQRHGVSVVCFRIGTCHRAEQNPAKIDYLRQQKWLSARDFAQAGEKAIEAELRGFTLLHLTSRIEDSPWDISETERLLGYAPQDEHTPRRPSAITRLTRRVKRRLGLS